MLGIRRQQRQRMAHGSGCDQRVGHVYAVRQGVFFNQRASRIADGLGDGQHIGAARLEGFLHGFQFRLVAAALRQLHIRHRRDVPVGGAVHGGNGLGVSPGVPDEHVGIDQHAAGGDDLASHQKRGARSART